MEVQCHTQYPELLFCVGYLKEINVYYSVSKGGYEGYLYFKSNNTIHYICKRFMWQKGANTYDCCNLVWDTIIGGDLFQSFIEWWYRNDIIKYKMEKKKLILNEKIASTICYHNDILQAKYGYMNEFVKIQRNILDFQYIFKKYLRIFKKHYNITPIVQLHMKRYYYFDYLVTNEGISFELAKRGFESEFANAIDDMDILKQNTYKMSHWEDNPYDSEVK